MYVWAWADPAITAAPTTDANRATFINRANAAQGFVITASVGVNDKPGPGNIPQPGLVVTKWISTRRSSRAITHAAMVACAWSCGRRLGRSHEQTRRSAKRYAAIVACACSDHGPRSPVGETHRIHT
jgi:hypothetical protein